MYLILKMNINRIRNPQIFNPYEIYDLAEDYLFYKKINPLFRNTFTTFNHFKTSHKLLLRNHPVYLYNIQNEYRKHHYRYY